MKRDQHLSISLPVNFNGKEYNIKAVKTSYPHHEVIYKFALPTIISFTNQCWISRNGLNWKVVMGLAVEQSLVRTLIAGIQKCEQEGVVVEKTPALNLKRLSA